MRTDGYVNRGYDPGLDGSGNPRPTKPLPWCSVCGEQAYGAHTRHGERATCRTCGRWSWDRKPLADKATHAARQAAHAAFDPLWNRRHVRQPLMSRGEAYRALQAELGLTERECHMAVMDAATAGRVPAAVERIKAEAVRVELERRRLSARNLGRGFA